MIFTEFKNNLLFMEIDTGETITKGVLVSINKTNGKIKKGLPNNSYPIGIAQTGGIAGDFIYIVSSGSADTTSVLVPGEACFSDSNGILFPESTATANNASYNIGVCSGTNSVRLDMTVYSPPPVINPNLSLNYIDASTADDAGSVNAYDLYADTSDVKPVDGIGGTPNITLTRNIVSPLSGTGDFRLTKDAVNRQGEGFSYLFLLQKRHQSKVLQVSFDYEILSGTYVSGDIRVYVRNEDTSELFELSQRDLQSISIGNKARYLAEFQTSSSGSSYRMIIHISSTSALAYSLSFNNFKIWEKTQTIGSVITEWTPFNMIIKGEFTDPTIGTNNTQQGLWRREGSSMRIKWGFRQQSLGTAGSGVYYYLLPNGHAIDRTKTNGQSRSLYDSVGQAQGGDSLGTKSVWSVCIPASNEVYPNSVVLMTSSTAVSSSNYSFASDADLTYGFEALVPIAGWGSSVIMSEQSEGRLIAATYKGTGTDLVGPSNPYQWNTQVTDTHGSVTVGANWKFTAKEPGFYFITAAINPDTASSQEIFIYKNGTQFRELGSAATNLITDVSVIIELNTEDYIDIRPGSSYSPSVSLTDISISIFKLQSPQSIGISEKLCARYTSVSGQTLNSGDIINFETKDFDTHGSVTVGANWKFIANEYGIYEVNAQYQTQNSSTVSAIPAIYKNGSLYLVNLGSSPVGILGCANIITLIELNAGDYIDVRHANATGDSLSTTVGVNQISIKKVK